MSKKPRLGARRKKVQASASKQDSSANRTPKFSWGALNTGFTIALIGLIGTIGAVVIPHYLDSSPSGQVTPASRLELDSAIAQSWAEENPGIHTGGLPGYEILDFKVQNLGTQLDVITGVQIDIQSIQLIVDRGIITYLPPDATYSFILPFKTGPCEAPVSEEVAPGHADRFKLTLQLGSAAQINSPYVYDMKISLLYGHNNRLDAGDQSLLLSRS